MLVGRAVLLLTWAVAVQHESRWAHEERVSTHMTLRPISTCLVFAISPMLAGSPTSHSGHVGDAVTVAAIGLLGAVIGSLATVSVQVLMFFLEKRAKAKADEPRKRLLLKMLQHPEYPWRTLDTLMHVIGADEETTKRLLLDVGARASEDGQRKWALLEREPLPAGAQ